VALALSALVIPASADAISDWAAKANTVATERRESPWSRARTLAIVNVAMFEAMNAVEGLDPHTLNASGDRHASIEAAAATAAHTVLAALNPEQTADLSSALAASLAGIANDVPKVRGYLLGKDAAATILALWFSHDLRREGSHGNPHPTAGIHIHTGRRSSCVAARGARAAGGDAGDRVLK
jgi:hypothetical protein